MHRSPLRPAGRLLATAALTLTAACATTPRPGVINTARLGMAKTTGTVPRGVVQLEAGHSQAHLDERTRYTYGETLVRIGLGPRTEARLWAPSYVHTDAPAGDVHGLGDPSLWVKHRLRDASGWAPAFSVMVGTTVPTGEDRVGAGAAQPELNVSAEWKLPEEFRLVSMASHRSAVAAGDRYGLNTVVGGVRRDLVPGLTAQAEYGLVHATRAGGVDTHHLRLGSALRLTRDLQLDGWAGRAETAGAHEYQFGVGFATRW